jgi:peptidyl-prolyl cis-trans isomerase A (cyclophilin A)
MELQCVSAATGRRSSPSPTTVGPSERLLVNEPLPSTMTATVRTNRGDIRVTLFPEQAPQTVQNFVGLAEGTREWRDPSTGETRRDPFYDGLVFHRVIANFMIQGGCPEGTGRGGPGFTFDDEIHADITFTQPFLLAMANAGTRMGKGTNGSQFFITVAPTPHLQGKHTIFGEVRDEESRNVVSGIAAMPTDPTDRPREAVVIEQIRVERG